MPLVNQTIETLHGGVSQQNIELRMENQSEEMINVLPTISLGLRRRNPTKNIKDNVVHTRNQWLYSYDRGLTGDEEEQYIISIEPSSNEINIIDTNGTTKTVNYEGTAQSYLLPNNGSRSFSAITIKDTTILVNKEKTVTKTTITPSNSWRAKAYVWVQRVDYNFPVTTTLTLGGTEVTATYPTNTSSTEVAAENIREAAAGLAGYSATRKGSIVEIVKDDGTEIDFTYSDTIGDSAGRGFSKTVQLVSDLPLDLKYEGAIIEIENSASTDKDDFYVKFENGIWVEAIEEDSQETIDDATMPHELVRESDGTFTFRQRNYGGRTVGDDITSPTPSFVDTEIRDLFFMKNRLGFITRTTCIMSSVDAYDTYYRTTTLSLLDDDPIDFVVDSTQAVSLEYCAFLQSSLIVFSDSHQFKIDGGDILSPRNIQAKAVTAYKTDMNCRPLSLNNKLFFAVDGENYSSVIEYVKDSNTSNVDGQQITNHVPKYIPNKIKNFVGSSKENMLFLLPEPRIIDGVVQTNDTIYVYKYYYEGNKLLQSAWFKWKINGDIYSINGLGDKLYIMCRRTPFGNTEYWEDTEAWNDDSIWSEGIFFDTIENIQLDPIDIEEDFRDNIKQDGTDTDAQRFRSEITLSEWMLKMGDTKMVHGKQIFKTIKINSVSGSDFTISIENKKRNNKRTLLNKYVVNRRPYIGGLSKDIKISIISDEVNGFQIGSLAYEGIYSSRGKTVR